MALSDARAAARRVDRSVLRALLIALLLLAVGALEWMVSGVLDRVHNTLTVIVFAILFAYFVYPAVQWLARRRIPIPVAALIVYAVLAVIVLGAIAWLAPAVAAQTSDLATNFPHLVNSVQAQMNDPAHSPVLARLPAQARDAVAGNAAKAGAVVGALAGGIGAHVLGILSGTSAAIIDVFLMLGLTLLILGDLGEIQSFGVRMVPRAYRVGALSFILDVDKVIGGFVRGQVLLALAVGIAGTIVLLAVGVPYAVLLGLLAGILSIVPLIGPIVAALVVLLISFFTVGIVKLVIVAILYGLILAVQQNVLTPMIVSRSVGVTPLVVFVALLLGSEAFGILGALLSIPIAGIVRVTADRVFRPDPQIDELLAQARAQP